MFNNIRLLTRLELYQLFGYNKMRHSKDPKERKSGRGLFFLYLFLYLMFGIFSISLAFGYCALGLAQQVPSLLILITFVVEFATALFMVGPVLFNNKTYERLAPMPIKPLEMVIARFNYLYLNSFIPSLLFFVPGMIVDACYLQGGVLFYLSFFTEAILLPFLPVTLGILISSLVLLVTSRMKHRTTLKTIFAFLFMIVCIGLYGFYFYFVNQASDNEDTSVLFLSISDGINRYFFPSGFFYQSGICNSIPYFFCQLLINVVPFAFVSFFVSLRFVPLCQRLNVTSDATSHKALTFNMSGKRKTLIKKEMKRLFSSTLYVTNSLCGYVFMVILSIAGIIIGGTQLQEWTHLGDFYPVAFPLILCFFIGMTTTTVSSISMEGKNWWISQSLPISGKDVIQSKLAVGIITGLPCTLLSILLFAFVLNSTNLLDYLTLVLLPIVFLFFMQVLGLLMNLKFPLLDWTNEADVVKKSKAVGFLMLVSYLFLLFLAVPTFFIPKPYHDVYLLGFTLLLALLSILGYRKALKVDFKKIQ